MIKKYKDIYKDLKEHGYILEISKEDYKGVTLTTLICHDLYGYKYIVTYDAIMRGKTAIRIHKSNPFSIYNINNYLKLNNVHFKCISEQYINKKSMLKFECCLCGEIVINSWDNVNRNDNSNRNHVVCPNCDKRTESLHASVLKQIFLYEHPDTIIEDKSFISPVTNKVCPTDIVNHRLKIAIEIQSQWHDFEDTKIKDKRKKQYWINKGYKFFDPDIRDYTILEMCNLFFNFDSIPDYVDMKYGNGINAKQIQSYLDEGYNMPQISIMLNISTHRLYDAISSKKIHYPQNYQRADYSPVIKFDLNWNKLQEYKTIKDAGVDNDLSPYGISNILNDGKTTYGGFNWKRK